MDHDRYGLDGMPIYPRPGHFDHVTGQSLHTFTSNDQDGDHTLALPLAIVLVFGTLALAYVAGLLG